MDVLLTQHGSYFCDQGPHVGMTAIPFKGTAYLTADEYNAAHGELHVVAGPAPKDAEVPGD
jgi:hypothetical protein